PPESSPLDRAHPPCALRPFGDRPVAMVQTRAKAASRVRSSGATDQKPKQTTARRAASRVMRAAAPRPTATGVARPRRAAVATAASAPAPAPAALPPREPARPELTRLSLAEKAARIQAVLDELYPATAIPLDHTDPFTLLVAVVLSAQTTDKKVNQVTPALFAAAPTPEAMASLSVAEIAALIREVG